MNHLLFYSPFLHHNTIKKGSMSFDIHCFGSTIVFMQVMSVTFNQLKKTKNWMGFNNTSIVINLIFPSLKVWIQKHHGRDWKRWKLQNSALARTSGTSTVRRHTHTETNRREVFLLFFGLYISWMFQREMVCSTLPLVGVTHNSIPIF